MDCREQLITPASRFEHAELKLRSAELSLTVRTAQRHAAIAMVPFLQSQFEKSDEVFRFETGELSDASVKIILKKIERLCLEFDEFAELDVSTPEKQKRAMGLLIGFRPWNYWHILESTANDMGLNAERSQRA